MRCLTGCVSLHQRGSWNTCEWEHYSRTYSDEVAKLLIKKQKQKPSAQTLTGAFLHTLLPCLLLLLGNVMQRTPLGKVPFHVPHPRILFMSIVGTSWGSNSNDIQFRSKIVLRLSDSHIPRGLLTLLKKKKKCNTSSIKFRSKGREMKNIVAVTDLLRAAQIQLLNKTGGHLKRPE